jgi:7-cyano-7-deazaguanine synthase in queuosine biosynthesis
MNPFDAPFRIWISDDKLPRVELTAGKHFRVYPAGIDREIGRSLLPRQIDLARLGMAGHVADGLLRRRGSGFRTPRLELEVLDYGFWTKPEVQGLLKMCLDFLSGDDDWEVIFRPDSSRHEQQPTLDFPRVTPLVFLYSGGLDSAAGLAAMLRERGDQEFIPVTVRHQFQRGKIVRRQFAFLQERGIAKSKQLRPLVTVAFVRNGRLREEFGFKTEEVTHRCRPFLFTAIAGIAAWVEGADEVQLYESGVGAVNLPLSPGLLGWRTTRSTHPRFLRLMSALISRVADREINFTLPFVDRTKAELVSELVKHDLADLATITVSCIMHPLRRGNRRQCGQCPACVYRRHALLAAGLQEPATQIYHTDLFPSAVKDLSVAREHLRALNAFIGQAVSLASLHDEKIPRFFRQHLIGTGVVERDADLGPFVQLFRRFHQEWLDLAERGRAHSWPWIDLLGRKPLALVG